MGGCFANHGELLEHAASQEIAFQEFSFIHVFEEALDGSGRLDDVDQIEPLRPPR
jgi:hypothetical protein